MTKNRHFSGSELWTVLQNTRLPIVMYGMGNGADKILEVLDKKGVAISDFFASDGFVRGHSFHGKRVLSFEEIREKYGNFLILLAFGSSLANVMENIRSLAGQYPLYAPDVPVCGGELFDIGFYRENLSLIEKARTLFADDLSRSVFDDIISYKLSGNISYLHHADSPKREALTGILSGSYTAYADLGAYTGDTVRETVESFPSIREIVAFEPSAKPYRKLTTLCETLDGIRCRLYPLCAWENQSELLFADGSGRNSSVDMTASHTGKTENGAIFHKSACDSLDHKAHFSGEKLLIKYDVEGSEREAFLGSLTTIAKNRTELIVSVYHKSRDLFELPLLIHEKMPTHRLFLRKHPYIPAWDINLYVCESKVLSE